jgi:hypothetical protein
MQSIAAKEHKDRKTAHCMTLMFEGAKMVMRIILLPAVSLSFHSLRSFAADFGSYNDDLSVLL